MKRINEERKTFIRQNEVIFGKHLFAGTNDRLHQLFQTFHHERNLHPRQLGKIFAKTLDQGKEGSKKRREEGKRKEGKRIEGRKEERRKEVRIEGREEAKIEGKEGRKERRKEGKREGRRNEGRE